MSKLSALPLLAFFLFLVLGPTPEALAASGSRAMALHGNLAFGDVGIGASKTLEIVIENKGNSPLKVTKITCPTGFRGNFSGTIAAGKRRTVSIVFTPTSAKDYTGKLSVASNKTSGSAIKAVSGRGRTPTRVLSVSGKSAFGNVAVGSQKSLVLTLSNKGNAPLKIARLSYPAGFSGKFSGTIPAGESRTVTVSFKPTASKAYKGKVTVQSNKTKGVNTLELTGVGTKVTRVLGVSGSLSFGTVEVGGTKSATLTLANKGNSPLKITKLSYPAGFSGSFSGTIQPGKSVKVVVTFKPTAAQGYSGKVTVASNKTAGANTLALSGKGNVVLKGSIYLSGNLQFESVSIGMSKELAFTIFNAGKAPLKVSKITYPAGFSGSFSGTINAGVSKEVKVKFTPTAVKDYSGTLKVVSDAGSGNNAMTLSGKGRPAEPELISWDLTNENAPYGTLTMTFKNEFVLAEYVDRDKNGKVSRRNAGIHFSNMKEEGDIFLYFTEDGLPDYAVINGEIVMEFFKIDEKTRQVTTRISHLDENGDGEVIVDQYTEKAPELFFANRGAEVSKVSYLKKKAEAGSSAFRVSDSTQKALLGTKDLVLRAATATAELGTWRGKAEFVVTTVGFAHEPMKYAEGLGQDTQKIANGVDFGLNAAGCALWVTSAATPGAQGYAAVRAAAGLNDCYAVAKVSVEVGTNVLADRNDAGAVASELLRLASDLLTENNNPKTWGEGFYVDDTFTWVTAKRRDEFFVKMRRSRAFIIEARNAMGTHYSLLSARWDYVSTVGKYEDRLELAMSGILSFLERFEGFIVREGIEVTQRAIADIEELALPK